jgi:hypothetical protein
MSRQGMIAAGQYAVELPSFGSANEAETELLASRDAGLGEIFTVPELQRVLDWSPESLKPLEQWFFAAGQPSIYLHNL